MFTAENLLSELSDIVTWLRDVSNNDRSFRYTKYENIINETVKKYSFKIDLEDPIQSKKFKRTTIAYKECFEIYIIYKAFKGEASVGFKRRIKEIIKGPDILEKDNPDTARDYLLELTIAAKLKLSGAVINFDHEITDIIAVKSGETINIECKRIVANSKIKTRHKEAIKQLKKFHRTTETVHNFIVMDISSFTVDFFYGKIFLNLGVGIKEIEKSIQEFIKTHSSIKNIYNQSPEIVTGIIFVIRTVIFSGETLRADYYTDMKILLPDCRTNEEINHLDSLFQEKSNLSHIPHFYKREIIV